VVELVAGQHDDVFVDTTAAGDTIVAVYQGQSVTNLTPVIAKMMWVPAAGLVNFNATAALSYRIAVASVNSNSSARSACASRPAAAWTQMRQR